MIKRTLSAISFIVMISMLLTSCGGSGGGSSTSDTNSSGAALVSIAVTPSNTSIATGATQQFTAIGTYSDSTTPIITGAVTWSSSNTGVATISSTSGRATSIAVGSAVISATSGNISGTTTLTITDSQLSAPTGVSTAATSGQVTISWNAVTGATSYNIYWSTTSGVTVTNGTKITGATSPYLHNSLTNGTTYYYIVTAVNGAGESAPSIQTSAMPQVPAAGAPTGVLAMPGDTQNTITWSTVTSATSYNIYWSTTSGVTKANGTKISNVTSPYTHIGLTNGTTYYYVVTAFVNVSESTESAQLSATPVKPAPVVTTLASNLNSPANIAVDSTSIYWTENITNGSIKKIPISGGTPITIASGLSKPFGIALDATNVYWTEKGSGNVNKVGKNGGAVTNLATGLSYPSGIVVDSTNVYWSEDTTYGNIWKVGLATGATPTILAANACAPKSIALDATSVYWGEFCYSGIRKVNISDGTITTVFNDYSSAYNIAIDDTSVYWTDDISTVRKVDKNGGTATNLVTGLIFPGGITVDSSNVYWTEWYTVKQVAISGGNVTIIDSKNGGTSIVGDSTNLYWIDGSSIKTIAK